MFEATQWIIWACLVGALALLRPTMRTRRHQLVFAILALAIGASVVSALVHRSAETVLQKSQETLAETRAMLNDNHRILRQLAGESP